MAFEGLVGQPMSESEILAQVATEVQSNYSSYQNRCFFLKLGVVNEQRSQVIGVKKYSDIQDFALYFWNSPTMLACVVVKFEKGRYDLLAHGFHFSNQIQVWPDKISEGRAINSPFRDIDKKPMFPYELLDKAFGEISGALSRSKSNIPM